ncbi:MULTISPECIES: glycosyltransferase family 8 protein [unclassified Yoonia]|uniref:glycosyltransferase family 8 protein n=1 Tax=unclassified Yoonia TaxID=2629118 RepID=UPI002AFE691F|nr:MULTISPECIES: glycosyltransferase family 8 protein [unclassified Yoonia]
MTDIRVIAENRPAKSRHAVVFCCDENYLPYAALAIHTLLRNNPERDYDICIASLDALDMPPALDGQDIRICRIDVGDSFDGMPVSKRLTIATYLRLALPEAFATDYDRILYLDCDVFVAGEALGDVFTLDLAGRPVGACMDITKAKHPRHPTPDQTAVGISGPYFNAGVLLIDTAAFREQALRSQCIAAARKHEGALLQLDQTLLNIVLLDNWAELHPAWNWQWAIVRPMFDTFIDPQIVHFVTGAKPWSDPNGALPIRFRETARRFFAKHYPELPVRICAPAKQLWKRKVVLRLLKHITRSFTFVNGYNRHGGDIMKVRFPRR